MDKAIKNRFRAFRPTRRRLIQLYSALLHNAYLKGFITGEIYKGAAKYACAPGLNCYSCPAAAAACPLGSLQNALSSAGHRGPWYVMGILLLLGVIFGRTVCGWLCPFGLVQELLHKIPTPKIRKSGITRTLALLKYVVLAVFVIALPLWYGLKYDLPLPAFCKYICPAGTLEGAGGLLANPANGSMFSMLGLLFTRKWVILTAVLPACVFCFRSFCRFLCPLGAIYGLFNRFSLAGVRVDRELCVGCGACVKRCGMDVRRVGDRECIQCGKCMEVCARGAISVKAGRITLLAPETNGSAGPAQKKGRRAAALRAAALAALCLALVWFNFPDPAGKTAPGGEAAAEWASGAPVGHGIGDRLPDFTLDCYDGSVFRLSDARGKVVVINLWATWCTPCKGELPYFNDLYAAHGDDIAMVVVHPSMILDDPKEYLSEKDYAMPFATDTDDAVWDAVGGSSTLPQTVVLNRRGEVVYNTAGSVTAELLETLYAEAAE